MTHKILVAALGGTIGSIRTDSIALDENNLKILDYCKRDDVCFEGVSPFSILSENMTAEHIERLFDFLKTVDFDAYKGVILLHGSDTLAYTACLVGNAFYGKNIVLTASDKPVEDKTSNAIQNFNEAVSQIINGTKGVFVSYDGIMDARCITSAGIDDRFLALQSTIDPVKSDVIYNKNILTVNFHTGMRFENYCLDGVDTVLMQMYHSATLPETAKAFAEKLKSKNISYYFVTHRSSADYETAQGVDNILFNCTMENAFAKMLLTK